LYALGLDAEEILDVFYKKIPVTRAKSGWSVPYDGKRMRGRLPDEPIASKATQSSQEEPAMGSTPSTAPSTDH
jgi:DNA-directed RNA polymerase subunit beta